MKTVLLILANILTISVTLSAQLVVENPAIVEQNQQELKIVKIVLYKDSTVVNFSVENKLAQGGWYCTDRNTTIDDPQTGVKYSLLKARGIPYCPAVHNFMKIGEVLNFELIFPGIQQGIRLINITENCTQACFSFKGVILDIKLNRDIKLYTKGVELYASNKMTEAIDCFTQVIEIIPENPTHVYGYSYYNLIKIFAGKNDKPTARFWLEQLEKSALPDKQYFIDALKKEGINLK